MVNDMDMSQLDKQTLIHIAMHDDVELSLRYAAAKELQYRHIPESIQHDIIYRFGIGTSIEEIAEENGLSVLEVTSFIRNKHRKNKSGQSWKVGYKQTLQAAGCRVTV